VEILKPTDRLAFSLEVQEWNVVMNALQEAPMALRLTGPVAGKLAQQFQERDGALGAVPGNGAGPAVEILKRPGAA
jgi:hypothetical protein